MLTVEILLAGLALIFAVLSLIPPNVWPHGGYLVRIAVILLAILALVP